MTKLTENVIRNIFGDTTFLRGLNYYNHGYVSNSVKLGDILYSQVIGSSAKPYEVRAFISDAETSTKCACPVGFMCKHGAALLLKWVNEPSSFVDADKFLLSLERMNKSEIICIIEKILKQKPSLIKVSKEAMDKGMVEESNQLTRMVLERGWADDRPPMKQLLNAMIKASNTDTLGDMCDCIIKKGSSGTAILLIPHLTEKAPELSGILAKNFINAVPVEMVAKVAIAVAEKAPEEGVSLCRMRINEDILRSHVHYDKAMFLLSTVRDIYAAKGNEANWVGFINMFVSENKGKKKLIERNRKEFVGNYFPENMHKIKS